ncbi:ankyrin repeat-containing protein, putative, partial [Eimeria necatrix]
EAGRKLVAAARDGKLKDCKELMKLLPSLDFSEPPYWRTALWHASSRGHEAVARLLLDKGASLNQQDVLGFAALHEAAVHGQLQIVQLLIERGASVDLPNNAGDTPLFLAVYARRTEARAIVALLLSKGAQTNRVNNGLRCVHAQAGLSCYHLAAAAARPQLAAFLLYRGSYLNRFSCQEQQEQQQLLQRLRNESSGNAEEGITEAKRSSSSGSRSSRSSGSSSSREAESKTEEEQQNETKDETSGETEGSSFDFGGTSLFALRRPQRSEELKKGSSGAAPARRTRAAPTASSSVPFSRSGGPDVAATEITYWVLAEEGRAAEFSAEDEARPREAAGGLQATPIGPVVHARVHRGSAEALSLAQLAQQRQQLLSKPTLFKVQFVEAAEKEELRVCRQLLPFDLGEETFLSSFEPIWGLRVVLALLLEAENRKAFYGEVPAGPLLSLRARCCLYRRHSLGMPLSFYSLDAFLEQWAKGTRELHFRSHRLGALNAELNDLIDFDFRSKLPAVALFLEKPQATAGASTGGPP